LLAPALVGVAVPAGTHRIAFHYTGFENYPELLTLAVLTLLVAALIGRRSLERRREQRVDLPDPAGFDDVSDNWRGTAMVSCRHL
jgi:hypothetical protein